MTPICSASLGFSADPGTYRAVPPRHPPGAKAGQGHVEIAGRVEVAAEPLPPRLKDHPLTGDWRGWRDLHIEPDWLLLYKIEGNDLILARTGSHADLFR